MARTLEEIDAALTAVENQLNVLIPKITAAENRLDTAETRISKAIKAVKAVIKRLKPNGIPIHPFDHWAAQRKMEELCTKWLAYANNETDDI
ncbi:MAG: hypothetical protein GTO41_13245 [Burkholderiales bacterium]|nr:hypothetical protein [Burkholderiales bacterium]